MIKFFLMCIFLKHNKYIAQLAGAVEYTDCNHPNECLVYDTKHSGNEVLVMLECWGMWSTVLCHCSRVHSGLEW